MNLEEYVQLSFSDLESFHCNNWAMRQTSKEPTTMNYQQQQQQQQLCQNDGHYYREKLCSSWSTPSTHEEHHYALGTKREKNQFLREMSQVRQDILRFRNEMNGLAKQMDGMEIDLNHSKDRVREIEKGLTATQEVNVNLQVLLEKALNRQKESDVYATRAMRLIHTNLATVVYETSQLRGRLTTIANYQQQHKGNVIDISERIREYTQMLEQAQGTIQSLQVEPKLLLSTEEESSTDDEEEDDDLLSTTNTSLNNTELYKYRIIKKRASNPEIIVTPLLLKKKQQQQEAWLPQKGLRILLNDSYGFS